MLPQTPSKPQSQKQMDAFRRRKAKKQQKLLLSRPFYELYSIKNPDDHSSGFFFGVPGMGVIYRVQVPNCEGRSNS